jgi:hypothetical protein
MASAIKNQIKYLRFGFSPVAIVDGYRSVYGDTYLKLTAGAGL